MPSNSGQALQNVAPDRAGIRSARRRPEQLVHGNTAGVDQAGDVVVRADQQRRRIGEGRVVLDDCGVNVAVRGNDGQVLDALQQAARDAARSGIRGQEPVWVGSNRL